MRKVESYHIELRPASNGYDSRGEAQACLNACHQIRDGILRHVDNVRVVDIEAEYTCQHCGIAWTERSAEYNGGCCAPDELENNKRLGRPRNA